MCDAIVERGGRFHLVPIIALTTLPSTASTVVSNRGDSTKSGLKCRRNPPASPGELHFDGEQLPTPPEQLRRVRLECLRVCVPLYTYVDRSARGSSLSAAP